jgi:hypothetical protein
MSVPGAQPTLRNVRSESVVSGKPDISGVVSMDCGVGIMILTIGLLNLVIESGATLQLKRGDTSMSDRAHKFLEQWKSEHVQSVPETHRLREVVRLVAVCREDAIRAGIVPEELRTAAGNDMIRSMLAALAIAGPPRCEAKAEAKSILHRVLAHFPSTRRRAA